MRSSLLILLATLLAPLPALAADAPFDLGALRGEWPGQDWVILERSLVFEMPSAEVLRVTEIRKAAILQESAREKLAMLKTTHRPGCRELTELTVRTVTRDGAEHLLGRDDLIEQPEGDHPTDPERGTIDLSGPRKGLAPGSLMTEATTVEYPAACYRGLIATGRELGHRDAPTLEEIVEIRCAGDGCHFGVDQRQLEELFQPADRGVRLERTGLRGLPSEAAVPVRRLPRLSVSSSADRLEAARVLAAGLADHEGPARSRVAGYAKDAKAEYPTVSDPVERLARFMGNDVPVFGDDGLFWMQGFEFGEAVKAADRPLMPLEWWAVAVAAFRPYGGIPVVLDTKGHLEPAEVGNVIDYDEIGVLIPDRGVVTHLRWIPMTEGTASALAGRWALRLDGEPTLARFPSSSAADRRHWTGTVSLVEGGFVHFDLEGSLSGHRGHSLRDSYETSLGYWKKAKKKRRSSPEERDRRFVGEMIFKRRIAVATVELPDDPTGIELSSIHTHDGLWQKGEGVRILALPLPEDPPLLDLVGTSDRSSDFAMRPQERLLELLIVTPKGHRLVGLPGPIRVDEGPVQAELTWEEAPEGAKLRFRTAIEEPLLAASLAPALTAAAELVRQASECYLIYEIEE